MDPAGLLLENRISPFYLASQGSNGIASPDIEKFNNEFVKKVELRVPSFSSEFEFCVPRILATGRTFSFHVANIPGFIGSLNDSFLIYKLGDRFINDAAKMIEHHFQAQGRACKVYCEGVSFVIALEGETPKNMDVLVREILNKGTYKYRINLFDIPNTPKGRAVKNKIMQKYGAQIQSDNTVVIDLLTIERYVDARIQRGIPPIRVGSFDLPGGTDIVPLKLKTFIATMFDHVKNHRFSGKINLNDRIFRAVSIEELVTLRSIELSRIDGSAIVRDYIKYRDVFDKALILLPPDFAGFLEASPLSHDTKAYLKELNGSIFCDHKFGVLNENAYETRINQLIANNIEYYLVNGDVSNLSGTNREYGRLVGDIVLKHFFDVWRGMVDQYAERGIKIELFRCGADEYGLIITGSATEADIAAINDRFNAEIGERVIRIPVRMLSEENRALLRNKGLIGEGEYVEFKIKDIFRDYTKADGIRIDRGIVKTMVVDHVSDHTRRTGDGETSRVKTWAKEAKDLDGNDRLVIRIDRGEMAFISEKAASSNFSRSDIAFRFAVDYFLHYGAPNSGIGGKAFSAGLNAGNMALSFGAAEAVIGLKNVGYDVFTKGQANLTEYGKAVKDSAMGGAMFGAVDWAFKSLGGIRNSMMPALGYLTMNDVANAPDGYKELALVQGTTGLLTFMGGTYATQFALSKIIGLSMRTILPMQFRFIGLVGGVAALKASNGAIVSAYRKYPFIRNVITSDAVRVPTNVLGAAAGPVNRYCYSYAGIKLISVAARTFGWQHLAAIGAKANAAGLLVLAAGMVTSGGASKVNDALAISGADSDSVWQLEAMFLKGGCGGRSAGPYQDYLYDALKSMYDLGILQVPAITDKKDPLFGKRIEHYYAELGLTDRKTFNRNIVNGSGEKSYLCRRMAMELLKAGIGNAQEFLRAQGFSLPEDYEMTSYDFWTHVGATINAPGLISTPFNGHKFTEQFAGFNAANGNKFAKYANASGVLELPPNVSNSYIAYLESKGLIKRAKKQRFGLMTIAHLGMFRALRANLMKEASVYQVMNGEDLATIINKLAEREGAKLTQKKFNEVVAMVLFANGIDDPGSINPGRKIHIPRGLFKA